MAVPRFFIYTAIFSAVLIPRKSVAQSDQFRFNHLTVDEGLSHTDANYIIQDHTGFMWIATYFGLNRFDGYTVKKYYNHNEPLNNAFKNRVRCLFADDSDGIWLGTEGGIQLFDPGTETYTDYKLINDTYYTAEKIRKGKGNSLYVLADNQLKKFKISGRYLIKQPLSGLQNTRIFDMTATNAGELYVATEKGISLVTTDGKAVEIKIDRPFTQAARGISFDNSGNLLFASDDQIFLAAQKFNDHTYHIIRSFPVPEHNTVRQILQDARGNYWVNAAPAILMLDGQLHLKQVIKAGTGAYDLNSSSLARIFIDRSQCLWAATFSGGVNYCDLNQKKFRTFQHNPENPNSLSGNYIRSIWADQNNLWVGTMEHGLNRYNFATHAFSHFNTGTPALKLKNNNVISLVADNDKRLWVGTFSGIQIIDPATLKLCHVTGENDFPPFMIENLARDCFGNIWFGNHTNRFGVIWKDAHKAYHVRYFGEGYFILPDEKEPQIFVSSTQGLDRYQIDSCGNIIKNIKYRAGKGPNALSSNYTYPISKQNDSVYWVGTIGGGLNRLALKPGGTYHIDAFNKKYNIFQDVEALEVDRRGNIWVAGNGLEYLNPDKRILVKYDKNDGLQGNNFKVGGSFKGPDGKLYFGGISGLTVFDPDEITANRIPAKPVITDILINNRHPVYATGTGRETILPEVVTYGEPLQLSYLQNNFVIFFSAMHFPNPLKCSYRYKLVGFDKDWIYTDGKKPSAFYSNLDYSNYKFIVQATNNDGLWSTADAVLSLTVTPPWWKSLTAKISYCALILTFLIGIYFYQAQWYRLKKDVAVRAINEAKREEMHKHREELYQQQLMFFTNISHEFRTPLTLIIGPLEALIKENEDSLVQSSYQMMLRNAKRLINLITELMNFKNCG